MEFTHYDDRSTFDYIVKKYNIDDPAVKIMADIVRGADTDRHDISKESAGLWAISARLSYNIKSDLDLLALGMVLYDALYSWATHVLFYLPDRYFPSLQSKSHWLCRYRHLIVTTSKEGTTTNYVVGMPTGINLWKSPTIGFSMEFVPYIRSENGTNKMNNFLFHPGILLAMAKDGHLLVGPLLKHPVVMALPRC